MYQNKLDIIVNIIESELTIFLESKEAMIKLEEYYNYEKYELVKFNTKDDLVL
ncbi:MAG: hypothetical protein ACI31S_04405 [Bacilli bacterium]